MSRKGYFREYRRLHGEDINAKRRKNYRKKIEQGQRPLFDEESAVQGFDDEQQTFKSCENKNTSAIADEHGSRSENTIEEEFAMAGGCEGQCFFACSPSMVQAEDNSGSGDDTTNILPFQSRTTGTTSTTPEKKSHTASRTTGDGTTTGSDNMGFGFVVLIFALLTGNTFFLITEQSGLYTAFGYTEEQSWFIAILSELMLVVLSGCATRTTHPLWKSVLLGGCATMTFVVVSVLDSSAQHRGGKIAQQTEEVTRAKKELETLEALEATALEVIARYDPKVYPTKITALMAKLEAPGPEGYSRRIREASKELATLAESSALADITELLLWQRRVMMFVNLILSGYLGFLLKGCVRRKAMQ